MRRIALRGSTLRVAAGMAGALALLTPVAAPLAARAEAVVNLNEYCQDHGATGTLADGRTAYCARVQGTDAFVWSYTRGPLLHDPNTRGYTCDNGGCHWPDGSPVPGANRCGILCGEPPTSGDVQSGMADCFDSGTPFEECEQRTRR